MAARTGRAPGHGRDLRAASHVGCAADARPGRPATPPLSGQGPAGRCGGKSRRASQGDELGYLCLFPDHIVGAEQVSQEQVELLLLRRGRRHCARREREREREGGRRDRSREARWRAGRRGGGGPSAGTGTSRGAGRGGPGGKGRGKGEREERGGASRPLTPAAAAGVSASLALDARGGAEASSSGAARIGHAPCGAVTCGARWGAGL